jgi:soluble lytic murein transglycosylase
MTLKEPGNYWFSRIGTRVRAKAAWSLMGLLALALLALAAVGSRGFWDALSPLTHKRQLYELSGEYKIDPLLLASIVKAESGFNPYASSERGALGLMQLLPETAQQLAVELKIDYQDQEDLYRDDINLRLGAYYFSKLLKGEGGNLVLALAAYNAGPAKVRSWKIDAFAKDQNELIDEIPVPETRAYVERVIKNYRFFKALQGIKRSLRGDDAL